MRLHLDFAEPVKGKSLLVLVDSCSKLVDAAFLQPCTASVLVEHLKIVSRLLGVPETIVTDNDPQFTSSEFAEFCAEFAIVHLRSSHYCPQSNGQAEKTVDTLKRAMESPDQRSLDAAVAAYDDTPNQALDWKTPTEVFSGRQLRLQFATLRSELAFIPAAAEKFKENYDIHHGTSSFVAGEEVLVGLNNRRRVPGIFVERVGAAMANVEVEGEILRRHIDQFWNRRVFALPQAESDDEYPLPSFAYEKT
ncbi:uncharacterized protein K02A2.6-like [Galendromus occidentalis]|uniref:Uncharacterized protein K02A2.6-like n=1 Tax=Galendromus occidentalis TaxID=34638 RepID=A0AAJ7L388_9ACAR|nr:uncharacterized protein K02A2.6-like [Galendromus occidentalis]